MAQPNDPSSFASLIKYAFVAGEVSPAYFGRADLEKHDFGMALAKNWFVDYRGGLTSRPGQEFCDYIQWDDQPTKFFEFKFAPDDANTYIVLFGNGYIRFLQDGGYVLDFPKIITGITKSPNAPVVTCPAHGFQTNDWIKMLGQNGMSNLETRTFRVGSVNTNQFVLQGPHGEPINNMDWGTFISGGLAKIVTLPNPYNVADFDRIRANQVRDTLRLTHTKYPIRNLLRVSHVEWHLNDEVIGNDLPVPTGVNALPSTGGTHGMAVAITAVMGDGTETQASEIHLNQNCVNYAAEAGYCAFEWTPVTGARYYNVYRSRIVPNQTVTKGMQLGYIGRAEGSLFTDTNIIPDFTRSPPTHRNPFALGAVESVDVLNPGTGFLRTSQIAVADPTGTGFKGYPIIEGVSPNQEVRQIIVSHGGKGYTNPTAIMNDGTGEILRVNVGPLDGLYPALSAIFQQRQVYASALRYPLRLWASRPLQYNNFDESRIIVASDSYEFDLDSDALIPIRHMISMRGGLLLMTQSGVWQLTAGNTGNAVSPLNALAEPHTYTGVSYLPPLKINAELLYIEGKGTTARMLAYNDFSKVYSGADVSILSNHLLPTEKPLVAWASAEDPFKVVWSVRSDGALLSFTTVKEQNVFAWTQSWTKGYYKDIIVVQENNTDVVYFVCQRMINGRWSKFIEKQSRRQFASVEDAFCVDCGLKIESVKQGLPAIMWNVGDLPNPTEVYIRYTDTAPGQWTNAYAGFIIRALGGKYEVLQALDPYTFRCKVLRPTVEVIPEDPLRTPTAILPFEWSLEKPFTSAGGLWHLEGETVSMLVDGNVMEPTKVLNGRVEWGVPATRAVVGIAYTCEAVSLPPSSTGEVIDSRRKRVMGSAVRLNESRGLKIGPYKEGRDVGKLFGFKERTNEQMGQPIELQKGVHYLALNTNWDIESQTRFLVDDPLPCTILNYVLDIEVGDDPN